MRYKSLDILIIFIFLLVGIYSSFQLFADDQDYGEKSDYESVAVLDSLTNTVKEKKAGLWGWNDSFVGSHLEKGDQVYTHSNSTALLKFTEGHQIALSPNTLFKIANYEEQSIIELERGVMTAKLSKRASKLNILINGKKYQVESSDARVQIVRQKSIQRINLIHGKIKIQDNKQEIVALKRNQFWEYSDGTHKVAAYQAELLIPEENAFLIFKEESSVEFNWQVAGQSILVVARDKAFVDIVSKRSVSEGKAIVKKLAGGNYFWRIENYAGNILSRIGLFSLKNDIALDIVTPLNNAKFFVSELPDGAIWLEWDGGGFSSYDLHVDGPEGFSYDQKELQKPGHLFKALLQGNYRFRIRGRHDGKLLTWSSWNYFSYEELPLTGAPKILYPVNKSEITLFHGGDSTIEINWFLVYGVEKYDLMINDESVIVEGNSFEFNPKESGQYKCAVRSIDPLGRKTKMGQWIRFHVFVVSHDPAKSRAGTRIELKKPNQMVQFQWKKGKRDRYIFQLSLDGNFSKVVIEKELITNRHNLSFPDIGVYYWRVREIDRNGKISFSEPVKVLVAPTAPPEKPRELIDDQEIEIELDARLSWPAKIGTFFISQAWAIDKTSATVSWKKEDNAAKYILEIYSDKKASKLYFRKVIKKTTLKLSNPPEGTFFWRIAIIDHWGRQSPFSDLKKLTITLPDEYRIAAVPKILEHTVRDRDVTFTWENKHLRQKYFIELSSTNTFTKKILNLKIKKKKVSITLPRCDIFYLRIRTINKVQKSSVSLPVKVACQRQKIVRKIKNRKNQIFVGVAPEYLLFSQVSTNHDVEINGLAFNSTRVGGKLQVGDYYELDFKVKHLAGTVFAANTLVNSDIKLSLQRNFSDEGRYFFSVGLGGYFSLLRYYQYIDEDNVIDQQMISAGPMISGELIYHWKSRWDLLGRVGAGFISQTFINAFGGLQYKWKKNIFLEVGIDYFYRYVGDKDISSHSFATSFALSLQFI